jgi:hypothetical protein
MARVLCGNTTSSKTWRIKYASSCIKMLKFVGCISIYDYNTLVEHCYAFLGSKAALLFFRPHHAE